LSSSKFTELKRRRFVAAEILRHIRAETIDPPIGEEAEQVLEGLRTDPAGLEKMMAQSVGAPLGRGFAARCAERLCLSESVGF
jgi:hypothetical protein